VFQREPHAFLIWDWPWAMIVLFLLPAYSWYYRHAPLGLFIEKIQLNSFAQASLELQIYLCLSNSWDYRYEPLPWIFLWQSVANFLLYRLPYRKDYISFSPSWWSDSLLWLTLRGWGA
jgi:hypothetical protein